MADAIPVEVANDELERFLGCNEILLTAKGDDDESMANQMVRSRMLNAICSGKIVVSESGETLDFIVPIDGETKTYTISEPCGGDFKQADKGVGDMGKANALIATLFKCDTREVAKFRARDYKVAQALLRLFMV